MKKMSIKVNNSNFNLKQTFLCGQCFRWKETENGVFSGIAMGKRLTLSEQDGEIVIDGITKSELPEWSVYFDLDTDYSEYIRRFSADKTLKAACEVSSGITGRLCESFGEDMGGGDFAFPTAEKLRGIEPEDLAPLRAGFRAKYIADAVNRVNSGEINFDEINELPLDSARETLKRIVGVGDKVADCVLLFAFHKLDAFPKDVWVKRLMAEFYPDGLPECTKGAEGVAQQYLFDYVRNNDGLKV